MRRWNDDDECFDSYYIFKDTGHREGGAVLFRQRRVRSLGHGRVTSARDVTAFGSEVKAPHITNMHYPSPM